MNLPRTRQGCRAPNAALAPGEPERIRELAASGYSSRQIKAVMELTCGLSTIDNVINGRTYKKKA